MDILTDYIKHTFWYRVDHAFGGPLAGENNLKPETLNLEQIK
jgi:hypothetical protein